MGLGLLLLMMLLLSARTARCVSGVAEENQGESRTEQNRRSKEEGRSSAGRHHGSTPLL